MKFHVPTRIVFQSGALSLLHDIVDTELSARRPFLMTDRGMMRSGIADRVMRHLGEAGLFCEVEPNPRASTVDRAGAAVREAESDLVVGLGGGSVLDAAKAAALLATNPGRIVDYEGKVRYRRPPLPVLAIPTTCGTGSEVTWVAVITDEDKKNKISIKGPLMFPALALVDPDLLSTLPPALVASTGMDALTHAIEAFTAKPHNPMTDMFALNAVRLVFDSIEEAYRDIGNDRQAREGMMLGSTMAGMAFGNSDVGAVHCIAETIGGMFDVPHGVANSVFLPYVMEFNEPEARGRYAMLARGVGMQGPEERLSGMLIERVRRLSRMLGIPSFGDLGIEGRWFSEIAEKSYNNNSTPSNPRQISTDDYKAILERAARGG